MTASAELGFSALSGMARIAGLVFIMIGAALALVFAFAAALVIGVMVLGAAIALRLSPPPRAAGAPPMAVGWVVETRTARGV